MIRTGAPKCSCKPGRRAGNQAVSTIRTGGHRGVFTQVDNAVFASFGGFWLWIPGPPLPVHSGRQCLQAVYECAPGSIWARALSTSMASPGSSGKFTTESRYHERTQSGSSAIRQLGIVLEIEKPVIDMGGRLGNCWVPLSDASPWSKIEVEPTAQRNTALASLP